MLTVIFTTRAGLAVHRDVIELLHMMGARDGYIARQFEREALRLGLCRRHRRAGARGRHAAGAWATPPRRPRCFGEEAALLPELHLVVWQWGALALLPVAAALAAMVTARLTVLGALARLP